MPGKVKAGGSVQFAVGGARMSACDMASFEASVIFPRQSQGSFRARLLSRNAHAVWSANAPEPQADSTRRAGGWWGRSGGSDSAQMRLIVRRFREHVYDNHYRSMSRALMPDD